MSLKSTTDILDQHYTLRKIVWSVDHGTSLRFAWSMSVASNLRAHSLPVSVSEGNLLNVLVSSAAWATQVRLQQREILKQLNSVIERPVHRIQCHISAELNEVAQNIKMPKRRKALQFTQEHLNQVEYLLATAEQDDFIQALTELRDSIQENLTKR